MKSPDAIDVAIIKFLRVNGPSSKAAIAAYVGRTEKTVRHRIKRLTEHGFLGKFTLTGDFDMLDVATTRAIVNVEVEDAWEIPTARKIRTIRGVVRCWQVTDEHVDLVLYVEVEDTRQLGLLVEKVARLQGVTKATTFTILQEI